LTRRSARRAATRAQIAAMLERAHPFAAPSEACSP
jgi:hypothetical protein